MSKMEYWPERKGQNHAQGMCDASYFPLQDFRLSLVQFSRRLTSCALSSPEQELLDDW